MDQERIGQFIKKIRIDNNLTQKEFAEILGVSFQAVSKWERGVCIPDYYILNEISKRFDVYIDEILTGRKKELDNNKFKKKRLVLVMGVILFTLFLILLIYFVINYKNNNGSFEFKSISTTCREFNITGSAAYNKDKSAIYISNINYCGGDDEDVYSSIKCNLYESYKDKNQLVSKCNFEGKNIKLVDYLKKVKINILDYSFSCKNFSKSKMYLEISAVNDIKTITYKVPITFKEVCE